MEGKGEEREGGERRKDIVQTDRLTFPTIIPIICSFFLLNHSLLIYLFSFVFPWLLIKASYKFKIRFAIVATMPIVNVHSMRPNV